jgi:hypothetical protein
MKGLVRVSVEHVQLALITSMMVLALLVEMATSDTRWFRVITGTVIAISFTAALTSGLNKIYNQRLDFVFFDLPNFYKLLSTPNTSTIEYNSTDTTIIPKKLSAFFVDRDRDAAARFIMQNTTSDERIFVGLTRHDKIFVNDVSSYFQMNRLPATKWHHFDPGLQSSADIQYQIIADIKKYKPHYLWLESTWNDVNEPNESAISSGITVLDKYIRDHYESVQNFGQISVWQLRG